MPLDGQLQAHIIRLCSERGVDPAVVLAVIAGETGGTWDPSLIGDGGTSEGLMQIHACDHQERMERLGVWDLFDPYQNVDVGIDLLAELMQRDKPLAWVFMAYNGGPGNADAWTEAGELTRYARRALLLTEIYREAADGQEELV